MRMYADQGFTLPRAEDWRDKGLCRNEDPDAWYPAGTSADARATLRHALSVCFACPVRVSCGQWALETREQWGVWGGMSEGQRRRILRRRGARRAEAA